PHDLRIPPEAGRRRGAEADGGEGKRTGGVSRRARSSLRAQRSNPCLGTPRGGLLRRFAPRNDDQFLKACFRIPAARKCRSGASCCTLEEKRAQGVPDAGRTREPCVQK